ncbi:MAG: TerB family tellurite resistance protein [Pseudomonadota bacterium]
MHIIIGVITLLGIAAVWYYRFKMARDASGELLEGANDVRLAARRLMKLRKHRTHPADAVDDPRLAAAGIAVAIATLDAPMSEAEMRALAGASERIFNVTQSKAEDIVAFGRWIPGQCATNHEAVSRLSKVVNRLAGAEAGPDLIAMITEVATADGTDLGEAELEAIDTVKRRLGMG